MNFDLVKFRVASPKPYAAPAAGSSTRAKKRHAAAIAMVFDKELFNKEMLKKDLSFPITIDLKPNDYFISLKYDKERKIEILTLVIKNWSDMKQEEWKSKTLEDFAKQNDKLPF